MGAGYGFVSPSRIASSRRDWPSIEKFATAVSRAA
jgi:hypothetical protein